MKNELTFNYRNEVMISMLSPKIVSSKKEAAIQVTNLPEILFITSYPPRECGIATYSQDLLQSLNNKFSDSFSIKVCALEAENANHTYPDEVKYILDTKNDTKYLELAHQINADANIHIVVLQHEFGFFEHTNEETFLQFLYQLSKPIMVVFHTVLPQPNALLKEKVWNIVDACESVVVMTKNAAQLLKADYGVAVQKIVVIPHGTHLVPHLNREDLKAKYGLSGRKILSTFGLLSSGKSIETTLNALNRIIQIHPDVLFLVIGKTHPNVVQSDGEAYRVMLEAKVVALSLQNNVKFINYYLPLPDLLEYLQLTDIYLFTSKDPNQAVSGTFSYAMSCGCPIISTPIPHAREVLTEENGIIIDFENAAQLAEGVNRLISNESLRSDFSNSALQQIVPTAWENSAIAHALLLQKIVKQASGSENLYPTHRISQTPAKHIHLAYRLPIINLAHIKKMTTDVGMIQFAKINDPDITSGYTLDDNARALIAICMHYELTRDAEDLEYMYVYLDFMEFCLQSSGDFLNYVDSEQAFTDQNYATNLSDSNGRAIWALGYVCANSALLPAELIGIAANILEKALPNVGLMHSTRAMAFAIKGIYYYNLLKKSPVNTALIILLANRLVQMYRHESERNWQWYESYLTYANSILPEAMLCAWQETGDIVYQEIAIASFDFLISLTFSKNEIKVISNQSWLHKGKETAEHGEQPIDVAYTILAMSRFYEAFQEDKYLQKIEMAFNWFLGNNHLHQIIYNPCTGGCYDGLEGTHVNLNQGAESTLSYLIARLTVEKYVD